MRGSSTFVSMLICVACSGRAFESADSGSGGASPVNGPSGGASGSNAGTGGSAGGSHSGGNPGVTGGSIGMGTGGSAGSAGGGPGGAGGTAGVATGGTAPSPDAGPPTTCNSASDCPRAGTVCQMAACLGSQCGFVANPSATPPGNRPGDCRLIICSPDGTERVLVDPNDTDDGNECTADSCTNGVAAHTPSVGSQCTKGYCNAQGGCVECVADAQCPGGSTECTKPTCVQESCRQPTAGTPCNGGADQCDGQGSCVDCVDGNGCDACCFCQDNFCIQG